MCRLITEGYRAHTCSALAAKKKWERGVLASARSAGHLGRVRYSSHNGVPLGNGVFFKKMVAVVLKPNKTTHTRRAGRALGVKRNALKKNTGWMKTQIGHE